MRTISHLTNILNFTTKITIFEKIRHFLRCYIQDYKQFIDINLPAILIGDFNIIPAENDVHKPEKWKDDALYLPEVRKAYSQLLKSG